MGRLFFVAFAGLVTDPPQYLLRRGKREVKSTEQIPVSEGLVGGRDLREGGREIGKGGRSEEGEGENLARLARGGRGGREGSSTSSYDPLTRIPRRPSPSHSSLIRYVDLNNHLIEAPTPPVGLHRLC